MIYRLYNVRGAPHPPLGRTPPTPWVPGARPADTKGAHLGARGAHPSHPWGAHRPPPGCPGRALQTPRAHTLGRTGRAPATPRAGGAHTLGRTGRALPTPEGLLLKPMAQLGGLTPKTQPTDEGRDSLHARGPPHALPVPCSGSSAPSPEHRRRTRPTVGGSPGECGEGWR